MKFQVSAIFTKRRGKSTRVDSMREVHHHGIKLDPKDLEGSAQRKLERAYPGGLILLKSIKINGKVVYAG